MGVNLTSLIPTFQIKKNFFNRHERGKRKIKNIFFQDFPFIIPFIELISQSNLKMAELGPDFCLGMLILIHIMGKHHVRLDFLQKVFFDTP